jgi:membrane-associated phospholipid phosphatase
MYDLIIEINLPIILWVQSWGSWLAAPMQFFSFLGTEQFFLIATPAIYWCWNARLGLRLGIFLFISVSVNLALKLFIHGPRPYWIDTHVNAMAAESSFGPPSGHAQTAVVYWGTLAAGIARRWAWALAMFIMLMVGLSRIYLGVHFPTDVLAGWVVGGLLLFTLLKLEPRVVAWMARRSPGSQIAAVLIASLGLILLGVIPRLLLSRLSSWELPIEWVENAARAFPGEEPIDPLALSGIITAAGALFGLASGAIWLKTRGGFDAHGSGGQLILRYLLGLVGILVFWFGLGQVFPGGESLLNLALRFLRYTLVGFWVSGLAPLLFVRLRLAQPAG